MLSIIVTLQSTTKRFLQQDLNSYLRVYRASLYPSSYRLNGKFNDNSCPKALFYSSQKKTRSENFHPIIIFESTRCELAFAMSGKEALEDVKCFNAI